MKKVVQIFCAVSTEGFFGKGSGLPWDFAQPNQDMKRFVAGTLDTSAVMGRETWESLPPNRRPLKNRENIVLSRRSGYQAEGAVVYDSLEEAIAKAIKPVITIIGGRATIEQALVNKLATTAFITRVSVRGGIPKSHDMRSYSQLLEERYLHPLVLTSLERHEQSLVGGGVADLEFRCYQ